jgi:hypothetical protein
MWQKLSILLAILIFSGLVYFPSLKQVLIRKKSEIMHIKVYYKTGNSTYYLWGIKKKIYSVYTVINALYICFTVFFYLYIIATGSDHIMAHFLVAGFFFLLAAQIVMAVTLGKRADSKYFKKAEKKHILKQINLYNKQNKL